ncbi:MULTISPECIES: response regulator [unclassified Methanoregula]|uniref:response regulator n=1 Tax=unclassified Methanoregula TaxID=2649730 RepID=UPI0009CAF4C4|nr:MULTISPECIES: response regulator [unclassified Methanoregula]OPX63645.1 MAG: transcriptional regulator PhoB [Methanoregula sp. PtaB.Bin085]OPY36189.1 MAG: transcriptional regulator PhoB [Methanoregula sp. PtaU1.Bin006]
MSGKIMLVEDDKPILEMMEILLERIGYEPLIVPDVEKALGIVKNDPPALLLLDIMMDPMDGWEFLEKVREEIGNKDLPVLLFTASPSVDERFAAMHDPRLGVLEKPVSIADLKAGLERFLGKK